MLPGGIKACYVSASDGPCHVEIHDSFLSTAQLRHEVHALTMLGKLKATSVVARWLLPLPVTGWTWTAVISR